MSAFISEIKFEATGEDGGRIGEIVGTLEIMVHESCECRKLELERELRPTGDGKERVKLAQPVELAKWVSWAAGETYTYAFSFDASDGRERAAGDWYVRAAAHLTGEFQPTMSEWQSVIAPAETVDVVEGSVAAEESAEIQKEPDVKEESPFWSKTIVCPKCEQINAADALQCWRCRVFLKDPAEAQYQLAKHEEAEPTNVWSCPKCGHTNPDDRVVCMRCPHERQGVALCPQCQSGQTRLVNRRAAEIRDYRAGDWVEFIEKYECYSCGHEWRRAIHSVFRKNLVDRFLDWLADVDRD